MKVAVTGGAGFIGANLCRRLLDEEGVSVSVIDDYSTGKAANLDDLDVEVVEGSILDRDALAKALDGARSVVHLAARPSVPRSLKDPVRTHEVNVSGTLQVLEAARSHGISHVVVASSSSVYGADGSIHKSEDLAPRPLSPYAASKLAAEAFALAYANSFDLDTLIFRFFNVYGPLQPAGHAYAACIPAFIHAALEEDPLVVNGDGQQSRDFTFVDDVTEVIVRSLRKRVTSNQPVNLAFGRATTLNELIGHLEKVLQRSLSVKHGSARKGDVRHSQADPSLLLRLIPDLTPLPLEEGLVRTVEWWVQELHR